MERVVFLLVLASACSVLAQSTYYSSYYGLKLTQADVDQYTSNGTLANCTNLIAPCDPNEPRRIDGTCNNLNFPSYGATRTPYYRILPATYYKPSSTVFDPQRTKSGKEPQLARKVRTSFFAEGRVDDEVLASGTTHFLVFFATDITNTRDTTNYVSWRTYCCKPEGAADTACAPNLVPETDYVHRFSGIRCLNMTRPLTFQTSGCLPPTTTPLRIVDATPTHDLSPVYGNVAEPARRTFSGGKLKTVEVNNRSFPDTSSIGLLLGINFFGIIFFWRHHNFIATQLAAVNPTWTDEQLFATAREINIAYGNQLLHYELLPLFMGHDYMVKRGIIQTGAGFRETYKETLKPQISLEYPVVLRWLHTLQDGDLRMYYTNGTLHSTFPVVDLTSNTDFLKEGDNMDYVTQGCFRQPTANSKDYIVDPDIVERGLGRLQQSNDIMTNDLAKNRYFGFQSYIHYREHCFKQKITTFDDLIGIVDTVRITQLKALYEDVADIELLAGLWVEKQAAGTHVPPTFACLVGDQLKHSIHSDRHWYERQNRPNAFNAAQLAEIRKAKVARMLCDIGDAVTVIQGRAFELPSIDNPMVSCKDIPAIDFTKWKA
ncbi:peroxidase-like [Trichoplusia ni]|uniref:Peroxidase-like n=1 Tax=Trichoplusia ni TaxID=7111 RepID=A0A7E5WGI4_TRINI|nr:peroxidase-like [Trichoplusia ni]